MNSKLRLALDLGPLLVFFLAYRFHGLLAATAALIVFTCISLTVTYLIEKKIAVMPLVSGIAVAVFTQRNHQPGRPLPEYSTRYAGTMEAHAAGNAVGHSNYL